MTKSVLLVAAHFVSILLTGCSHKTDCSDTAAAGTVDPSPFLVFADPHVVWNGLNTPVSLFGVSIDVSPQIVLRSGVQTGSQLRGRPSAGGTAKR